jgi:hypothetical protein
MYVELFGEMVKKRALFVCSIRYNLVTGYALQALQSHGGEPRGVESVVRLYVQFCLHMRAEDKIHLLEC